MTIDEFKKKAIEGGYFGDMPKEPFLDNLDTIKTADLLLDPKSFQAVGKVEWAELDPPRKKKDLYYDGRSYFDMKQNARHYIHVGGGRYEPNTPTWVKQMHRMVDFLADGGSIEDFLKTL